MGKGRLKTQHKHPTHLHESAHRNSAGGEKNKWLTENQLGHTVSYPERERERNPPLTEGQMDPPICCGPVCQRTTGHQTSCTWVKRPLGSLWGPSHWYQLRDWELNCGGQTQTLPGKYYQSSWATSTGLTGELRFDVTSPRTVPLH